TDLALALHDEPHRHRLDAPGRQPGSDLAADQGAQRVAHEPIDDPPRLLRVDEIRIDLTWVSERISDRALGDLVEGDALRLRCRHVRGLGDMPGDGFTLAVE